MKTKRTKKTEWIHICKRCKQYFKTIFRHGFICDTCNLKKNERKKIKRY